LRGVRPTMGVATPNCGAEHEDRIDDVNVAEGGNMDRRLGPVLVGLVAVVVDAGSSCRSETGSCSGGAESAPVNASPAAKAVSAGNAEEAFATTSSVLTDRLRGEASGSWPVFFQYWENMDRLGTTLP